jgi:hypothetical protein
MVNISHHLETNAGQYVLCTNLPGHPDRESIPDLGSRSLPWPETGPRMEGLLLNFKEQ